VFSFSGSEGYVGEGDGVVNLVQLSLGQPLSKKGDFELGLSTWLGCVCRSNPRTYHSKSSKWSTLETWHV
jgi:hypothetical protein